MLESGWNTCRFCKLFLVGFNVQSINHRKTKPYSLPYVHCNDKLYFNLVSFISKLEYFTLKQAQCLSVQHIMWRLFHLPLWSNEWKVLHVIWLGTTILCLTFVCVAKGKPSAQLINLLHNTCLPVCTGVDFGVSFYLLSVLETYIPIYFHA